MSGYGYAAVESALAQVFGVDQNGQHGWLRGRIKHLQKLGLQPKGPGKGRTISYRLEDIEKWLIAIEMEHFGIDPTRVVDFIQESWKRPRQRRPLGLGNAIQSGKASLAELAAEARVRDIILAIKFRGMSEMPEVAGYDQMISLRHWLSQDDSTPRRTSVFNLSIRMRSLDRALATIEAKDNKRT